MGQLPGLEAVGFRVVLVSGFREVVVAGFQVVVESDICWIFIVGSLQT